MLALASNPVITIAVELIDESPLNPRRHFRDIPELAESLKLGQLEAIVVRPNPNELGRYELANGARRLRAALFCGIEQLEAKVRDLTDAEMMDIILGTGGSGNVDPLTPLEEAAGYADAMNRLDLTLEQAAERFGKSESQLHRLVALLNLPDEAKAAVESGVLAPVTAYMISRVPGVEQRSKAATAVLHPPMQEGPLSHRAARELITQEFSRSLNRAPFDVADAKLVPEAGACATVETQGRGHVGVCPFYAGTSPEVYGDLNNPHTCMQPSCFAKKVEAARAKKAEKLLTDGKKQLSAEENAAVFPEGVMGLHWDCEYVVWKARPPGDLLKPEVISGKVPEWPQLCTGELQPQVWVGFDQKGAPVELVKLREVALAVDVSEQDIFKTESRRRYGMDRSLAGKPARGAQEPPAQRAVESETQKETRANKLVQAKAEKASAGWLDELMVACETQAPWSGYTYWSLVFDRQLAVLTDEDIAFLGKACPEFVIDAESSVREQFKKYAGRGGSGTSQLAALVTAMLLTPALRAEGVLAKWVVEWQDGFVASKPEVVSETAPKILTEWQRAHAEGMSPQKIAATYKAELADVCGALELDLLEAVEEVQRLRADCETAFENEGLMPREVRDGLAKVACRGVAWEELTQPEQFRELLRVLSAKASVNNGEATSDADIRTSARPEADA